MKEDKFKRLCRESVAKILDANPTAGPLDPLRIRDLIRAFAMGVVCAYGDENDSESYLELRKYVVPMQDNDWRPDSSWGFIEE